jgi:hypothetical protein
MGLTDIQTHLRAEGTNSTQIPSQWEDSLFQGVLKLTSDSNLEIVNLALKT